MSTRTLEAGLGASPDEGRPHCPPLPPLCHPSATPLPPSATPLPPCLLASFRPEHLPRAPGRVAVRTPRRPCSSDRRLSAPHHSHSTVPAEYHCLPTHGTMASTGGVVVDSFERSHEKPNDQNVKLRRAQQAQAAAGSNSPLKLPPSKYTAVGFGQFTR